MPFTPVPPGYYDSAHWKATAARARRHYNFTCQRCGKKGGWLDVHHTPEAYRHLWKEPLHLLKPLCHGSCHTKGRITAWRIKDDRKAHGYVNAIDVCFDWSWRAFRWLVLLPLRAVRRLWQTAGHARRPGG